MKLGPNLASVAALIGEPSRANMLTALLAGKALTASELALEAGTTKQTASTHLAKLLDGGMVRLEKQGRHRYYALHDATVAAMLESVLGVAQHLGHTRSQTGPKEPALRYARVCYDHLAGDLAVALYESLLAQGWIGIEGGDMRPTAAGTDRFSRAGVDMAALGERSRPVCRPCLDWSARRPHLAGSLGAALLERIFAFGWAARLEGSRVVQFTPRGEVAFRKIFRLPP